MSIDDLEALIDLGVKLQLDSPFADRVYIKTSDLYKFVNAVECLIKIQSNPREQGVHMSTVYVTDFGNRIIMISNDPSIRIAIFDSSEAGHVTVMPFEESMSFDEKVLLVESSGAKLLHLSPAQERDLVVDVICTQLSAPQINPESLLDALQGSESADTPTEIKTKDYDYGKLTE